MSKSTQHPSRSLVLTLAMATTLVGAACEQPSDVGETGGQAITSAQITQVYTNGSGTHQTISTTNNVDPNNPFFQSLGTNGRSCVDCHQPAQAWGISPAEVTQRFGTTGTAPIFRLNDGSNAPNLPVSTVTR